MTQKIKVSKPGSDVLTTGNANLSFSSDLATHALYNVVDINKPVGSTVATYAHNLGYIPKTWIYMEGADGTSVTYLRIPYLDFVNTYNVDYYVGTANITIETTSGGTADSIDFRAVIFTRSPNP